MRASFTTMLEVNIPAICREASVQLAAQSWALQPSCIPYDMAVVAVQRLEHQVRRTKDRQTYCMLSRSYRGKYKEAEITKELKKQFTDSLDGNFPIGISKVAAQDLASCMHTIVRDLRYKGPSNAGWRCDCKRFVHIGLCSCCLVVMHIEEQTDLNNLIAK